MARNVGSQLEQEKQNSGQDLTMKGNFAPYDSPFLRLIVTLLSTRYIWVAFEDINPLNILDKPKPAPDAKPWAHPKNALSYLRRNFAAMGMGLATFGLLTYYSNRILNDIKTLYADAVAYELDKKPQDVTLHDIFVKSQNEALKVTRGAFIRRSLARYASASSFLFPWQVFRDHKEAAPKYDANLNAGVGIAGLHLSWESFFREPSFFDSEQKLAGNAINHTNQAVHQIIEPQNIQTLLLLQRKHLDKTYTWPSYGSFAGQNEDMVASRIADLMNQTYNNVPKTEQANFTLGKFNYLVGFKLLDNFPTSLGFIELANRSTTMKEVKNAAAAIAQGQDPQAVFQAFGIDIHNIVAKAPSPVATTERVVRFSDLEQPAKEKMPQSARTPQDFAQITNTSEVTI